MLRCPTRIDLDQRASSGKVYNSQAAQKKEVASGRAALAEPLQLLGTCTVQSRPPFQDASMAAFLYRCPRTRLHVQGWIADERSLLEKQNYEAVNCLACGGVHLVNPASGKSIDDEDNNLK